MIVQIHYYKLITKPFTFYYKKFTKVQKQQNKIYKLFANFKFLTIQTLKVLLLITEFQKHMNAPHSVDLPISSKVLKDGIGIVKFVKGKKFSITGAIGFLAKSRV